MTRSFEDYLNRGKIKYGEKFDSSGLSKQFIPYYENGERIWVQFSFTKKSGRVGVTTGWKPSFLLMLRKDSRSSPYLLEDKDVILGIVKGRKK